MDKIITFEYIKNVIGNETLMAFNIGTEGIEQKVTALGIDKASSEFFIKCGQTSVARENVENEYFILKQLSSLGFVPKVLDFYSKDRCVILKTDVLKGKRVVKISLERKIIDQLIVISSQKVKSNKTSRTGLRTCFAHGDFCPWNMMIKDDYFLIYDWEMAGDYVLGYDLFTFIFQTNFLLDPAKKIAQILEANNKHIEFYFSKLNVKVWNDYLIAFAMDKITLETQKGTKGMTNQYLELLAYAKAN